MRFAAACGILLLTACSTTSGPADDSGEGIGGDRVRVLASIKGFNNDDPRIRVSSVGRTVTVAVTTYGDGCHSKGDTELDVNGLVADVRPFDYTARPGTVCTQPLLSSVHEVSIPFDRAGIARVRVHGIDASRRSASNMMGTQIVVERTVVIQ